MGSFRKGQYWKCFQPYLVYRMSFLMNILASSTAKRERENFFQHAFKHFWEPNRHLLSSRITFPFFHKWNSRFYQGLILNVQTSSVEAGSQQLLWLVLAFSNHQTAETIWYIFRCLHLPFEQNLKSLQRMVLLKDKFTPKRKTFNYLMFNYNKTFH